MSATGRQRLTSWKEIAAHLGRDARTVMRWNSERGLPVHRIPGTSRRVIFAYSDELDAWASGELWGLQAGAAVGGVKVPKNRHRYLILIVVTGVLVGAAAGAVAQWSWKSAGSDPICEVDVTATHLRALTAAGATLWTYAFREAAHVQATEIVDLDGDGHLDVVASIAPASGNGRPTYLLALSHRGRPLWERTVDDTLTFGSGTYAGPWQAEALLVYRSAGAPFIAWAVRHDIWWPSILAVFNGRGERVGSFVNSGWIRAVHATSDGRYLLVGGLNNARRGAAFAILDASHPEGVSPEDSGSVFECKTCVRRLPLRYYVMPWTDIVDPAGVLPASRRGHAIELPNGSILLRAVAEENAESLVEVSSSFEVKSRQLSDGYWSWHGKLQREGVLSHGREHCPSGSGPPLLEWTPEHGWREVPH